MINPKILLVEDEYLLRLSLELNLRRKGYTVVGAEDGRQGLALLQEQPCDLLISDYLMEGMTGMELIGFAQRCCPAIKTIIITGFADVDTEEKIKNSGADSFLFKPVSLDQLIERISSVCS